MAIIFNCECGRKLQVADTQGGKKGKCPQCGKVLVIPIESPAVVEEPALVPEEVEGTPTQPCPHCKAPINVGAVFCTKCGTDLRTGQKHVGSAAADAGYDMLKLWPDVFTKPAHAVGVIVESPLNADNFVRALGLLAVGLVGFMLLWTIYATPGNVLILGTQATRWFYFPVFFIAGIIVLAMDAFMASLAGKQFGTTGTSLAQTVMALIMTNAVNGFVSLLLALLAIFGSSAGIPPDMPATYGPWVLLAWSAWLTTSVIYRAYDTSQPIAIMFGVGAAALKGFAIVGLNSLMPHGGA